MKAAVWMRIPLLATAITAMTATGLAAQDVAEPAAPPAQAPAAVPASVLLRPATFATWSGEAHLAIPASSVAIPRDSGAAWWGLNAGAAVGATAALTLTQAFCGDDNGCVGRSIGAVLAGSLLGGALKSGMDY